jgi:predicted ArsR family transcriptional regulator
MEAWHVARTMRVLELLACESLSAPQLAEALGAHPRTARRVLEQLVEEETWPMRIGSSLSPTRRCALSRPS